MTEAVVTASPDASVHAVAELMREHNVGSVVLVAGDGRPVGFITDRDIVLSVVAAGAPRTPSGRPSTRPRR